MDLKFIYYLTKEERKSMNWIRWFRARAHRNKTTKGRNKKKYRMNYCAQGTHFVIVKNDTNSGLSTHTHYAIYLNNNLFGFSFHIFSLRSLRSLHSVCCSIAPCCCRCAAHKNAELIPTRREWERRRRKKANEPTVQFYWRRRRSVERASA